MSRIGKIPIDIPKGVEVKINEGAVMIKGPKGSLTQKVEHRIKAETKENQIILTVQSSDSKLKALHGLYRALIYNMVKGVSDGFEKKLIMSGVGYRGQMQGKKLVLQLGFSHPVEFDPPEGIVLKVQGSEISISGSDKALVGQAAADIRSFRPVEPYKGKGIKYIDEIVRRKAGKAAKAAGAGK